MFWGRIPTPCTDLGKMLHRQADPGARRSCQIWRESVQWVVLACEQIAGKYKVAPYDLLLITNQWFKII